MLFFSVGLPSRFAEWCDAVVAQLAQSLGPAEGIGANTLEEFATGVIHARSPYLVVMSRLLGQLQSTLAQANLPFIVAVDDPRRGLRDLVLHHDMEFLEATRQVASSCATVVGCVAMPNALVLHADKDGLDPVAAVAAIARHFELSTTPEDVLQIVETLAASGISARGDADSGWLNSLGDAQRGIVAGALDPYTARFGEGELGPITWERELFFVSGKPNERLPASHPVDITGGARFLIYGPYITLPPGSWSATVALGFSKEAAEIGYVVDFVAGTQLSHVRIEPGSERQMEVDLHFTIDKPLDQPIVMRVASERAAFDGRLALGHVTLSTHGHMRPETRNYFTTALSE